MVAQPTEPDSLPEGALSGVKVADFTWVIAGPLIAKYFADHGADVVRVESAKHPDALRLSAPFKDRRPGLDRSGYFAYYHANTRGLALDLTHPRGKATALRLAAWADLVIENFAPGVMDRLGLGYDDLKRVNEGIIMVRTSNMGQTGPWSGQPGFGFQLAGLAGFISLCGEPGGEPIQPYGAYTDYTAPHFGATAILAALLYRDRTGKGQCIDLSQHEASLHFLSPLLLDYTANGRLPVRMGNRSECAAPHGAYRCQGRDRWCVIAVSSQEEWQALCQVMGAPHLAADERFRTLASRKEHEDDLDRIVQEWTAGQDAGALVALLQQAGVAAGVVKDEREVLNDPQLAHRGHFWQQEHPEIGPFRTPGPAFLLSETPARPVRPSPLLGQHTEEICREILGMADDEFLELLNGGVLR